MAPVSISEIVSRAQKAIDGGNYGSAIDTCQRILGQFPEFATAHRLMGEAYLEQGDRDAAREAFYQTLLRDPQSIPAHIGLGLIAEESGEGESALAHFQAAWETDPRRRDLRQHVTRLSREVYGAEGRLYLTRAALASLHFHAGRWSRAITEASQVLQEFENRIDMQIRLAEALWRYGDDQHAERLCTAIVESLPSAVVPLLILADIRRRQDRADEADQLLERARAIDPDGVRASDLILVGWDDQAEFFSLDSPPIVDEDALSEYQVAAMYAPAPDFMTETEALHLPDDDFEDQLVAEQTMVRPAPAHVDTDEVIDIQPFRWEDITVEDLDSPSAVFAGDDEADEADVSFELFSDEDLERARPPAEGPRGFTGILESLQSDGVTPFDPGGVDGETLDASDALRDAPAERDDIVVREPSFETSRPEPDTSLDDLFAETQTGVSWPVSDDAAEVVNDPLAVDWSMVDEEIERAIPGEMPRGYTDELSQLDQHGFEPFSFDPDSLFGDLEDVLDARPETPKPSEPAPIDDDPFDFSEFDFLDDDDSATERDETSQVSRDLDIDAFARSMESPEFASEESAVVANLNGFSLDDIDVADDRMTFDDEPSLAVPPGADGDRDVSDIPVELGGGESQPDDSMLGGHLVQESGQSSPEPAVEPDVGYDTVIDGAETVVGIPEVPEVWLEEGDRDTSVTVPDAPDAALAASGSPTWDERAVISPVREESAGVPSEPDASASGAGMDIRESLVALGLDRALVGRFRDAKARLVEAGVVTGSERLPRMGPTLEDLEADLSREPGNPDRRLALAEALVEVDPRRALDEYRWVFRHAGAHFDTALAGVVRIAESGGDAEVFAHRLAGAMYRRRGDWNASASHYSESLAAFRGVEKTDHDG